MRVSSLRQDKGKIPKHTRTLSHPLQSIRYPLDIKTLDIYILEVKQHGENTLQNANHNLYNIHQHVTNEFFQGWEGAMSVAILAPSASPSLK